MDNQRKVVRSEETIVAGEPDQAVVSQTQTAAAPGYVPVAPAPGVAPVAPVAAQTTVETTATGAPRGDRVVAHNVAHAVVDPAAEKAAGVDWFGRTVWFIVGLMAALLAIRFILLLAGANEDAGFAQLIYGLTGWMVAPFLGLFGKPITYPGAAQTGVLEFESLVAIVVYALIGWGITKIAALALGTNRTSSVVYSDTERRTRI